MASDYYDRKIQQYKRMYSLCLEYIKFEHGQVRKENRLIDLKDEVIEKGNTNRIKTVKRILENATYDHISIIDAKDVLADKLKVSRYGKEIDAYDSFFEDLRKMGPKEYMIKCLEEIVRLQNNKKQAIEEEKRQASEDARNRRKSKEVNDYSYTPASSSYTTSSTRTTSTTKNTETVTPKSEPETEPTAIIEKISKPKNVKERLEYNGILDEQEIKQLAAEYDLGRINYSSSFISHGGINGLVGMMDVEKGFTNGYKMRTIKIAKAFNDMYRLAIEEVKTGYRVGEAATKIKRLTSKLGGVDFVERYTRMYDKLQKYISRMSKSEKEAFDRHFSDDLNEELKDRSGTLITPEVFRARINEEIRAYLVREYSVYSSEESINYLSYATRYMDAQEISWLYGDIKEYRRRNVMDEPLAMRDICEQLILMRMPKLDPNSPDFADKVAERRKAIRSDYLFVYSEKDAKEGYAEKLVGQQELMEEKKKEYFRMGKFQQMIQLMNFNKLKGLSKKEELTDKEEEEIKRMF